MASDKPLVSVIIPTYNCASTVEECLKSVRAQTYSNIEVVVVDNFSTDGTDKIAATMARVVQVGPERSAQVNAGARHARGVYLYRIDGDMVLDPSVVQACVEAIETEGFDAIAVPNRSQGDSFWARVRTLERDTYLDDPLIVAARFWKREVFEAVGGLDESLVACEDYDLHNRLMSAGYRIGRVTPMEFHLGEADSLWAYAAQSFYYGPSALRYVHKHPVRGLRQMTPLRDAYLRHWRALVSRPLLLLGLVLLKLVQYASAMLGIAANALGFVADHGRIAHQALVGLVLVLSSLWALGNTLPDLGIRSEPSALWAVMVVGIAIWQLVGRRYASRTGDSLSSTLFRASLAFSPLLLILMARPETSDISAWEAWRILSILAFAAFVGWLTHLAGPVWSVLVAGSSDKTWAARVVQIILLVAVVVFVVFFVQAGVTLLYTFSIRSYEMAAVDQALWASSHGGAVGSLSNLMNSSIYGRSIFAHDAAPTLLLLLPIYAVGLGGPELLLISQSLALGLGAVALYRFGKDQIGALPAMLIALAYLTNFLTARLALGRFIILTWSIPLLLFALGAFHRRRYVHYYLLVTLALACGLDVAWAVAVLGLYLILVPNDRPHGLITLLLGLTWLILGAMAFVPFFGGTVDEVFGWSAPPAGESFLPWAISRLLRSESRRYVWVLLGSTGFVPLLGIPLLLPALPRLLLNLLSDSPAATSLGGQYEIALLPFFFAAAIAGLGVMAAKARRRDSPPPQLAVSVALLVASICTLALYESSLITVLRQKSTHEVARLEAGHRIVSQIAPQASVATQSPFAIALAHRKQLTILPQAQDPNFILFDVFHPNREPDPSTYQESLLRAFHNPMYGLRTSDYGCLLFERGLDPTTKLSALVLEPMPSIQYARRIELADTIAYLGFDLPSTQAQPGETLYVTHYWQSLRANPVPYLQFTAYPGTQLFEEIAFGLLPPNQWGPGDVVLHRQLIALPVLPDGDAYEIVVGLWFDEDEPALRSPDQLLGRDVIRIATITVSGADYEIHPWPWLITEGHP